MEHMCRLFSHMNKHIYYNDCITQFALSIWQVSLELICHQVRYKSTPDDLQNRTHINDHGGQRRPGIPWS